MRSRKYFVVVMLLGCFLAFRPPVASVTAEEDEERLEHLEREVNELEQLIDRAIDGGREEEARDLRRKLGTLLDELEEREHGEEEDDERERERHEDELEMHMRELEMRRHALEVEMAEMEMTRHRMELISNPLSGVLDAIDMASHHLEPEEAAEFFAELLNDADHFPVKQRLRQRLVELNLELDRREEAKKHLRKLIIPSDD